MTSTNVPAASGHQADPHEQPEPGRAVVVQLAVQGWATTRQPSNADPSDDPFDPAA